MTSIQGMAHAIRFLALDAIRAAGEGCRGAQISSKDRLIDAKTTTQKSQCKRAFPTSIPPAVTGVMGVAFGPTDVRPRYSIVFTRLPERRCNPKRCLDLTAE
jgi:hypothetical protein